MKIKYEFVNETKEIDVADEYGAIVKDLNRQEYNNQKKETRRHCTIEKSLEFGTIPSGFDLERDYLRKEEMKKLNAALDTLTADQKDLVRRVFFNDQPLKEIAAEYGVKYQSLQDRLETILKKLKKNF